MAARHGNGGMGAVAAATWNERVFVAAPTQRQGTSNAARRAGQIVSALPILFLLFDSVVKFFNVPAVAEAQNQLGIPQNLTPAIAIVELACLLLYMIPRTSPLGAMLLTGYLGGAVAIHVRVGNPLFSHILFPVYVGVMLWAGLCLRNPRLREAVFPPKVKRAGPVPAASSVISRRMNIVLWIVQGLLAGLFLFSGGMKLLVPYEVLMSMGSPNQIVLPELFVKFIGVAEVLGAIGLILPRLLGIRRGLTPLAAASLVIIMIGATVVTALSGEVGTAAVPFVTGLLCALVAYKRGFEGTPAAAVRTR